MVWLGNLLISDGGAFAGPRSHFTSGLDPVAPSVMAALRGSAAFSKKEAFHEYHPGSFVWWVRYTALAIVSQILPQTVYSADRRHVAVPGHRSAAVGYGLCCSNDRDQQRFSLYRDRTTE